MIKGVTFELLTDEVLKEKTEEYNPAILSSKSITYIEDLAVLPYDCYPSIMRADGIYKDNLSNLYQKFNKEPENKEAKSAILEEIKKRWEGGKNGRWRGDLCGKRCNFTARSVLTPNPYLKLTSVGLPSKWKNKLTLTEKWNEDAIVLAVVDENGNKFDARYKKPNENSTVIRQLNEGELVIVNRQPTLRDSNFVAMEVFWTKERTIQMHPGVFSMFDADCDGDEINIHVPQINQKELEKVHIKHSVWNYGDNSLGPSVIQDATTGLCLKLFENKARIHKRVSNTDNESILKNIHFCYKHGCAKAYMNGSSVGFDFKEVDRMIDVGAKGKKVHKEKIRIMLDGISDDDTHFEHCKDARIAMISTSLKTADTGYISRRMAYHFDDIIQNDEGECVEYGKMFIQYPNKTPQKLKHIKNIGLYLMTALMPPLTQKMLDSFHAASAGETVENKTDYFVSLVNCTSEKLKNIYTEKGILSAKKWLYDELVLFFDDSKLDVFWIQLLVDILCVTGKPLGITMTNLIKRVEAYRSYDPTIHIPILKLCKFGSPYRNLMKFAQNGEYEDLKSNHAYEVFF